MKKLIMICLLGTLLQADSWAVKEKMCKDTFVDVSVICGVFRNQICVDTFVQNWPKIKYSCKETSPWHYNKYRNEMKKMGQL